MLKIDEGYLVRTETGTKNSRKPVRSMFKGWYLVKYQKQGFPRINLGNLLLDKKYVGKRIRLKMSIEIVEELE